MAVLNIREDHKKVLDDVYNSRVLRDLTDNMEKVNFFIRDQFNDISVSTDIYIKKLKDYILNNSVYKTSYKEEGESKIQTYCKDCGKSSIFHGWQVPTIGIWSKLRDEICMCSAEHKFILDEYSKYITFAIPLKENHLLKLRLLVYVNYPKNRVGKIEDFSFLKNPSALEIRLIEFNHVVATKKHKFRYVNATNHQNKLDDRSIRNYVKLTNKVGGDYILLDLFGKMKDFYDYVFNLSGVEDKDYTISINRLLELYLAAEDKNTKKRRKPFNITWDIANQYVDEGKKGINKDNLTKNQKLELDAASIFIERQLNKATTLLYIDDDLSMYLFKRSNGDKKMLTKLSLNRTYNDLYDVAVNVSIDEFKEMIKNSKLEYSGVDMIFDYIFSNNINTEDEPLYINVYYEQLRFFISYAKNFKPEYEALLKYDMFTNTILNSMKKSHTFEAFNSLVYNEGSSIKDILGLSNESLNLLRDMIKALVQKEAGYAYVPSSNLSNLIIHDISDLVELVNSIRQYQNVVEDLNIKYSVDYFAMIIKLVFKFNLYYISALNSITETLRVDAKHIFNYLMRSYRKTNIYPNRVIELWNDYLRMAKDLEHDLSSRRLTHPDDLVEAHDDMVVVYNMYHDQRIENGESAELFKEKMDKIRDKYSFSDEYYSIIVPEEPKDLIVEGRNLNHCVGSYVDRVIKDKTKVVFLRSNNDIDKSYFTIELDGSNLVQIRGFSNKSLDDQDAKIFLGKYRKKLIENNVF